MALKKIFKINNIVFKVDPKAELFLYKLQSLLTSKDSSVMLAQTRDILIKCVMNRSFAHSFKAFLDTAIWYRQRSTYINNSFSKNHWTNNLNGRSFDGDVKWIELLGHCMSVDRKVCICGFILNDISRVVGNILEANPTIDFPQLKNHIINNISGYDFLVPQDMRTFQFWVNTQDGHHYPYNPYVEMDSRPIEIIDNSLCHFLNFGDTRAFPFLDNMQNQSGFSYININMEGTDKLEFFDFTCESFNYAIFKASKALWKCMKSGAGQKAWEVDEEVFLERVKNAYQQDSWIIDFDLTSNEMGEFVMTENITKKDQYMGDWLVVDGASESNSLYELGLETNSTHNVPLFDENNWSQPSNNNALVPRDHEFNSKIHVINPALDKNSPNDIAFLYHEETYVNDWLTYVFKFDIIFDHFSTTSLWVVFTTLVRFIYGLYKLNFFFLLFQRPKIRRFMKWLGKKFK